MKTDRRQRGWLLFEFIIMLLILGAFILPAIVSQQTRNARNATRDRLRSEYVDDFALFYRAVRSYIPIAETAWTAGSRNVITVAQLRTANLLPASWAARDTGDGTTPLGHSFVAYSIKAAGAVPTQTVITESGNASLARLESLGFEQPGASNAVPGLLDIKRQVAARLWSDGIPAGTLDAGALTVLGAGSNGWTRAVNAWFVSSAQQPFVVAMLGFPELEPPTTVNDPRGSGVNHGSCAPVDGQNGVGPGGLGWSQPSCPADRPVQLTSWPVCSGPGVTYDGDFVEISASAFIRQDVGAALGDTCSELVSGNRNPQCSSSLQNYSMIQEYTNGRNLLLRNTCNANLYMDYNPPGNIGSYWPLTRTWAYSSARNLYCCER